MKQMLGPDTDPLPDQRNITVKPDGDLKPKHKETTNRFTMVPTTDIDSGAPAF